MRRHRWSLRLYRALLRLYPGPFRTRFGEQMVEDFRDLLEEGRGSGWGRVPRAWGRAVADLLRSLPREWRSGGREEEARPAATAGPHGTGRREGRTMEWIGGTARDARHGLRTMARSPGFTLSAVAVLALGIGIDTAVFSTVNAYLFRGLPFPEADRLVAVEPVTPVAWDRVDDLFEVPVSWDLDAFTLYGEQGPELVEGAWVTPGFFEAFGIRPALGRSILPEEGGEGGASVAVISWDLWQQRYGGDPGILGRSVSASASDRPEDEETFTIVGVLPEDFWFFHRYTRFLAPLRVSQPLYMGRLRPDVTRERAEAEMTLRARAASSDLPPDTRVTLRPMLDRHVEAVRPTLLILMAAVSLVLLIACANVAVLLLVRATRREKELTVRRALGAGSGRIARQLVVEGVILALVSGVLGVGLAWSGTALLADTVQARLGSAVPGGAERIVVDGTVLWVTLAACMGTGFLFGLVPLLGSGRPDVARTLSEGGRGSTGSGRQRRLQSTLIGLELALSTALLVAAGLMIRSARNLQAVDPGFEPAGVLKARIQLRARSYPEEAERIAFFDGLVRAVRELPDVEAAGLVLRTPLTWNFGSGPVVGEPDSEGDAPRASALGIVAGPGYFEAMGIELRRGRDLGPGDGPGSPEVAVISRSLAEALWPGQDPVGHRFREPPGPARDDAAEPTPWRRVVGVVDDVTTSLVDDTPAEFYVPYAQLPTSNMELVVRTRPGTTGIVPAIQSAVRGLDPRVPVSAVVRLEEALEAALAPSRFVGRVLGGFALFALLLACVGLYGGVAYAVAGRRREVAIRISLGASRRSVHAMFLRDGLLLVAGGLAAGIVASLALGRLLASRLHGVGAVDATTYATVALLLAVVALGATWLPARSAARTDPMGVLREE